MARAVVVIRTRNDCGPAAAACWWLPVGFHHVGTVIMLQSTVRWKAIFNCIFGARPKWEARMSYGLPLNIRRPKSESKHVRLQLNVD